MSQDCLIEWIDVNRLQPLLDAHYKVAGLPVRVIQTDGTLAASSGYQDLRAQFPPLNPWIRPPGQDNPAGAPAGANGSEPKVHQSDHGFAEVAAPIRVAGKNAGTVVIGPFFLAGQKPDEPQLRDRAKALGLDEAAYLAALQSVPVFTLEKIQAGVDFIQSLLHLLATLGMEKRQLQQDHQRQQRLEQELVAGRESYRTLVENIPGVVYRCEVRAPWRLQHISESIASLAGYPARDFLSGPKYDFSGLIVPEDMQRVSDLVDAAVAQKQPYAVEYRIRRMDGQIRWVIDRGQALFSPAGEALYLDGFLGDITEQKAAEEARRASEQRFRALFDGMGEGVALHRVIYDAQGQPVNYAITDVNPRYVEILNLQKEAVLNRMADEVYGASAPPYLKEYAAVAETGQPCFFETYFPPMDRHFSISVASFQKGSFATIFSDITDRIRSQKALLTEKQRLERASVAGQVALWDWELATNKLAWSSLVDSLFGFAPGEFPRTLQAWESSIHPEDAARVREALERHLRDEAPYDTEYRIQRADGVYVWLHDVGSAFRDENRNAYGMAGSCVDITHQKAAEERLRQSEERYRLLFENNPHPMWVYDTETLAFLNVNEAAIRHYGYSRQEFLAMTIKNIRPDEDAAALQAAVDHLPSGFNQTGTWRHIKKDGAVIEVEIISHGMDLSGRPARLVLAHDVTALRRAEAERARMERQIQQAQKLESLGVLAGGIAHDFNNLLMAILGNVDLAMADVSPMSPVRQNLAEVRAASSRAADLCKQMLAYSGKGRFVIQHLDLAELVKEMTHMLEVSISKKALLRFNFAANLPSIQADATQIRQIIMNLVINASEAIGNQSGVISIATGAMDCDPAYFTGAYLDERLPAGLYVYLEVADTGCGMSAETKARIFDPFFTTKFTGRGLGLAAALGIVRGHKGAVKIYSELGRGTTFKVLFPAAEGPAAPLQPAHPAAPRWRGSGTILLVDDEESVRAISKRMLERLGFRVLTAANGCEAVEIFRRQQAAASPAETIVCVLLDLTMPRMDGEETYRELRRLQPDVRVIMASGYNEQEVTQRFAGKGLAGFIQKPYTLETLIETLKRTVNPPGQAAENP